MTELNHNIETAYNLGMQSLKQAPKVLDAIPFVVLPEGSKVHKFEEVLDRPLNLQQSVNLHTAKDLISYVNRFADNNSVIFVDIMAGRVKAILDYHEAIAVNGYNSNALQRNCSHVAYFIVDKTTEFKKIEENSGRKFFQQDFALFLEDIMPYIAEPVATELYEIVQTLSAKTNIDFKSGIRTNNGEVTLTYNENIEATAGREGKLTIPEEIKFGIQIHRGGNHYALPARFRYRVTNGNLTLWYDLDQLEKAIQNSMEDTIDYIRNGKEITDFVDDQEVTTLLPGVNPAVTILEGTAS
ncbi:DUF2303 family protein [Acinetobacter lactucae]|uniref:DUF2303 family protein n=1 Tax=Acinetobacter lactucae TaxID=1785128 RepID=UPI00237C4D63|nr:DUF2303 family protein [Acinetobacter lactucae]MDD9317906.1 DUF2303 family protein [Acinetobacter lactucae]